MSNELNINELGGGNSLLLRRRMMMAQSGDTTDWKSIFAQYLSNVAFDTFQVPDGATSVPTYAFYSRQYNTIILPSTVTSVGAYGFHSSKCTKVIYNSVPTFATNAFQLNTTITDIVDILPTGLETTGAYMFRGCTGLVNVHIPQGLKTIQVGIFYEATNLRSVTFPSSITDIYGNTFYAANGIQEMIFEGTTPPLLRHNSTALGATSLTFPIYVPDSAVNDYKAEASWANYASRVKGISERT